MGMFVRQMEVWRECKVILEWERNKEGEQLSDFVVTYDMAIANTFFRKDKNITSHIRAEVKFHI